MGWKNVKEHYRIAHQVQVTEEGICIGSPYIHAIIVISREGELVKEDDRTLNDSLTRYQAEMRADPAKLREMVLSTDTFSASIPVYTYSGAEIIEKQCEALGWPNVTHDGTMMFENTFFAEREHAIEAARSNCEASIMLRRMEISDHQQRLAKSNLRLEELLANAAKLGLPVAVTPAPSSHVVATVPCPCTLIEQDEDCLIGYPSMVCGVCEGKGHTTSEQVTALACEMIKIASDVGEPDDPFAAWESLGLLQSQNVQLRATVEELKFALFSSDMTIKDRADQSARLVLAATATEGSGE